jgi:hypothetical protein
MGDGSGQAESSSGQSASAFAASFVTAVVVFAVEVIAFLVIKDRFSRIYLPRTYLVPERERTKAPSPGYISWAKAVLQTSNADFVMKAGLDAYFFLRYLRTLLKIFVPAALIIMPILIPLNAVGGKGPNWTKTHPGQASVSGLDVLAWSNVRPDHTGRYWAHWLLAVCLIAWVCYVAFDELRGYIRMRQAYITSPQHRLRASATTVLVSSIPTKWCTVEALDGLYDVFPGGLRNIWINRNFDELNAKISKRDKLSAKLEAAETDLIKKCFKKNAELVAKSEKHSARNLSKEEREQRDAKRNSLGVQNAYGEGITTGNPHQVRHNVREAVQGTDNSDTDSNGDGSETQPTKSRSAIPIIGEGFNKMTKGFGQMGRGIMGGIRGVNKELNNTIDTTNGFMHTEAAEGQQVGNNDDEHRHRFHGHQANHSDWAASRGRVTDASPTSHAESDTDWNRGRTHVATENDRQPLGQPSPTTDVDLKNEPKEGKLAIIKKAVGLGSDTKEPVEYGSAYDDEFANDSGSAKWREYLEDKDRDTIRLPIKGWQWMPSLPFIGEKVDTIYYCRREVARLNMEIEDDQAHPERFPLMNSAFVQFNHQVAAHMACQTISHHLPKQMAPRLVEIDPNDVIWDNLSMPWWQMYIRTAVTIAIIAAMIVLWAFPVAFTGSLSQLQTLAHQVSWLAWILKAPAVILNIIQGVLPAVFLSILMFLLPVFLRFLIKFQGTVSGNLVELSVQQYYFCFLFVQLFLVVTISGAATTLISFFSDPSSIQSIPNLLATNIPKASNYFFSYMLLQALSTSAGALVQVGSLIGWFILAPLLDSTARQKFRRQTNLSNIQWGTFFPVYTNLACIGLIYSVISPLILIFNIVTFSLFWFVYRYNTLYVTRFTRDTGGLLYPNAINTTFTGVYVLEIVLIGLFFLIRDQNGNASGTGQAIGMIIILILTAGFQWLLNSAFAPLFKYLPITLEDDAVRRDEEFARAMNKRYIGVIEDQLQGEDLEDELEERERRERDEDQAAEDYELQRINTDRRKRLQQLRSQENEMAPLPEYEFQNPEINLDFGEESKGFRMMRKAANKVEDNTLGRLNVPPMGRGGERRKSSWADRNNSQNRRSEHFGNEPGRLSVDGSASGQKRTLPVRNNDPTRKALDKLTALNPIGRPEDLEAQQAARSQLSNALFAGLNDELEDLTPEERDILVQRAFQHSALRAKRPVVWLPRDDIGISDDEIRRMGAFSKYLWLSNVRQGLDSKGRCIYSGAPPDFDQVDLIQL